MSHLTNLLPVLKVALPPIGLALVGLSAIYGSLYALGRRIVRDDARAARVARFGQMQVRAAELEQRRAEMAGRQ